MGKASGSDLRPWQIERRRYQNACAQRRRRQRQKEGLTGNKRPPLQTVTRKASSLSKELISAIFDCFTTDTERSNVALIMADENFSLRDIVKYGLITLGYAVNPEILRITEDLAFYSWSLLVLSAALTDIHLHR
ncbi:BZIP domain-containing protein [Fusarium sp. LHS14.1]|nr:BZIP domain-containing protein [Fusarium sp. LHS14.1]